MATHAAPIQREQAGMSVADSGLTVATTVGGTKIGDTKANAHQDVQQDLSDSPRMVSQRRLQNMLSDSPRVVAQMRLSETLAQRKLSPRPEGKQADARDVGSSRTHSVAGAQGPTQGPAVAQRRPVSTGQLLHFNDDEIPAALTLVGFQINRNGKYSRYRVDATGQEFFYDYVNGLYYDLQYQQIDPSTLAPAEQMVVSSGAPPDDPSPGGEAIAAEARVIGPQIDLHAQEQNQPAQDEGGIRRRDPLRSALRRLLISNVLPAITTLMRQRMQSGEMPSGRLLNAVATLVALILDPTDARLPFSRILRALVTIAQEILAQQPAQADAPALEAIEEGRENLETIAEEPPAIYIGDDALTVDQAFARLAVFIKPSSHGGQRLREVLAAVQGLAQESPEFGNMLEFAGAVQDRIEGAYNVLRQGAAPQHFVDEDVGEVMILDEFRALADRFNIPPNQQQVVAAAVAQESRRMAGLYDTVRELVAEGRSPEAIIRWFTRQTAAFSNAIIAEAVNVVGAPQVPFAFMMAGSGARQEMFPGSDLDLAMVAESRAEQVEELLNFQHYVEDRLKLAVAALARQLGVNRQVGLAPDTGVFGVSLSPEALAQRAIRMNNTAWDAMLLMHSAGGANLVPRFMKARGAELNKKAILSQLYDLTMDFKVGKLSGHFDIKQGYLRLITLSLRELARFFGIDVASSFDRIRALVEAGRLDEKFGASLLRALITIARIRLKMHLFYNEERDDGATHLAVAAPNEFVLDGADFDALSDAHDVLVQFHQMLTTFATSGGEKGLKQGFFDRFFSKK